MLGGRKLGTIIGALGQRQHYRALGRMFVLYPNPLDGLRRYLFGRGSYPVNFRVRTPVGLQHVELWTKHDFLTLNEVFCRQDYPADHETAVVADIGSNIGISALYFLTRNDHTRVYLHEPVPVNVERLRRNLAGFENRYVMSQVAVGLEAGRVEFGLESTGRYGGVGLELESSLEVDCVGVNQRLRSIQAEAGRIEVLKLDVEGLESALVQALAPDVLDRIDCVYAECIGEAEWCPGRTFRQYGSVAQWSPLETVVPRSQ